MFIGHIGGNLLAGCVTRKNLLAAFIAQNLGMKATAGVQDQVVVAHTWDGKAVKFYHPAVQSAFMFLGEFLCLVPYLVSWWRLRSLKLQNEGRVVYLAAGSLQQRAVEVRGNLSDVGATAFVFALPTLCDATSTMLMNIGLYYTSASVYQMLRGTVVFFAGLLTIAILQRRLHLHHWQGMLLIMVGAFVVGLSSVLDDGCTVDMPSPPPYLPGSQNYGIYAGPAPSERESAVLAHMPFPEPTCKDGQNWHASNPLLGNIFVITAQIFSALQFVVEEKFVKHYRVPALLAVGLEGFWGLVLCCVALPLFQNLQGPKGYPIDDAKYAITDAFGNPVLLATIAGSIASIAVFNWAGVSVTKRLTCTARLSIDACRTVLVWLVSLLVGWEAFRGAQLLGFFILICGSVLYNELLALVLNDEDRHLSRFSGPSAEGSRGALPGSRSADLYEISPSLFIGGVNTQPHSVGSMGGMTSYSPLASSDPWGAPSLEATHRGGLPLSLSATQSMYSSSAPRVVRSSQQDGKVSGSLYNAFYSGMDVGAVRLNGTGTSPKQGQYFGTPVTPRPSSELPFSARVDSIAQHSQQGWSSCRQLPASAMMGFESQHLPQAENENSHVEGTGSRQTVRLGESAPMGMLSAEFGRRSVTRVEAVRLDSANEQHGNSSGTSRSDVQPSSGEVDAIEAMGDLNECAQDSFGPMSSGA